MEPPIVSAEPSSEMLCRDEALEEQTSNTPAPSESSLDNLAKGIASLLTTAFTDFESKASDAVKSQDNLVFAIDRLTKELDQLLEDAPVPFIMQHAAKISAVRKRVTSLNSLLRSIQRRLDNIDRTLSSMSSSRGIQSYSTTGAEETRGMFGQLQPFMPTLSSSIAQCNLFQPSASSMGHPFSTNCSGMRNASQPEP